MGTGIYEKKLRELVVNWKLRLIVSALFTIAGLSALIAVVSGQIMGFEVLDQTIAGIAVFIIVLPVFLIIADLPKIDERTIAEILDDAIPALKGSAQLILKPYSELSEEERNQLNEVESIFDDEKMYRYLPLRPVKQAAGLLAFCLAATFGILFLM